MALIIQKFGGTSVSNAERINNVAKRVVADKKKNNKIVVVLSAMGKTTDELIGLAKKITKEPSCREMDMLLSTGEQISVSLLAMAIHKLGEKAISFTGPQVGILTDNIHQKAKIISINGDRIREELAKDKIVIVAGYQGLSKNNDITTLGRGGSDTTAVAIAAVLKADLCEIYTDVDGIYSIDVPGPEAVLVFSSVSFSTQTITVGNRSTINVVMVANITSLDEVVITGYGTQKKKEITSAITSVKADDFNKGNVNSPAALIQGKVAGLSISKAGGNPNGGYDIRLRGMSTIGANTQPLIVIDGVIGESLDNVDPNDIQSIDVLKDGSAAAIYGTRGSSGVIIVTTKKGRKGTARVDYNGYVTVESVAKYPNVMDATEWRALSQETGLKIGRAHV